MSDRELPKSYRDHARIWGYEDDSPEIKIKNILEDLGKCYAKTYTEHQVNEFYKALRGKGLTVNDIVHACDELKKECTFPPTIADLTNKLDQLKPRSQRINLKDCNQEPSCNNTGAQYRNGNVYKCRCEHGHKKYPDWMPYAP